VRRLVILAVLTLVGMFATRAVQGAGSAPPVVHLLHAPQHSAPERVIYPGQGAVLPSHTAFTSPLQIPPVLTGPNITLTAAESDIQILPGPPTKMWTFNGTFPGPTIRRPTGQTTQVTVVNNLPASVGSLSTHNHGNHSSSDNDGQPADFLIPPGGSRIYTYPEIEDGAPERGATQWYHDHVDMVTSRNVTMGLAGVYILDDPADPPTLPSGAFDVPLVIGDRSFDANNQIIYNFTRFGVTGDHILVNGVPQPFFNVASRKYRFRALNGSTYRHYVLELSNGQSMLQIGTESGLLPAPVARTQVRLGPGERADLVIDFTGLLGQNIVLNNTAGSASTAQIMQFRVNQTLPDSSSVPATLRPLPNLGPPIVTRTWDFAFTNNHWTVNGLLFDHNRVDARPVLGTTERWIFRNVSAGFSDKHTVHVHGVDQQLISRNGAPPAPYELMKETWFLDPGETIEVLLKFSDHLGRFVIHCHLLEHEDDGMMAQFEVVAPTATPTATFTATATATSTATATTTGTATATTTATPSSTTTSTVTATATPTATAAPASTATATPTGIITGTPSPAPTPTAAVVLTQSPPSLSLQQAVALVQSSGQPGVPCAATLGQVCQVGGAVNGTGTVTGSMSWSLTARVPAGVAAGVVPFAVLSTTNGLQGFPCAPVVAGAPTLTCVGTTAANALLSSTATVVFAPGVIAVGTVTGPGGSAPPRPLPARALLPPPLVLPPPIVVPPPPSPPLVPVLPPPLPAVPPAVTVDAGVPVIPEADTLLLAIAGLLGIAACGRRSRR
jgi:FtsP/CotA-like multicopper oxidase with cupredoxin domain